MGGDEPLGPELRMCLIRREPMRPAATFVYGFGIGVQDLELTIRSLGFGVQRQKSRHRIVAGFIRRDSVNLFEADRLLYHSTLGLRVIKKKKRLSQLSVARPPSQRSVRPAIPHGTVRLEFSAHHFI